jgi:hypothetical protein
MPEEWPTGSRRVRLNGTLENQSHALLFVRLGLQTQSNRAFNGDMKHRGTRSLRSAYAVVGIGHAASPEPRRPIRNPSAGFRIGWTEDLVVMGATILDK